MTDDLAARFQEQRPRLRAVAYRMLGSLAEAEDVVQEAWIRLAANHEAIDNLNAWLTTVVARLALNHLRGRKVRETHIPDPIVDSHDGATPEHAALLADGVGLALLVVLETLAPAERIAFVLHDVFDMSFDQIAPIVQRTPDAARQLASRARRRVQDRETTPDGDVGAQRRVVDAFLAAAHAGDVDGLLAVLDPDIVLRNDVNGGIAVRGATQVANGAKSYSRPGMIRHPALVNGVPGAVCTLDGQLFAVMAFTVRGNAIVEIDILTDPTRIAQLGIDVPA